MATFLDDTGLSHFWDRLSTMLSGKQDTLTFDNTPTANSDNPVKSSGIKTAIDDVKPSSVNVTLSVASWDNNSQTVTVSGMTSTALIFSTPDPSSAEEYASCGLRLTSQSTDALTFTCDTVPSSAITVQIAYWLI